MEISQALSLASDFPSSRAATPPGGMVQVNTERQRAERSSLAVAEMGPVLLGGTAPGDWLPQPSPSRSPGSVLGCVG